MRRFILAAVIFLPLPASAGSVALTVTIGANSQTETVILTDGQLGRIVAAHNSGGKTNAQVFDDIAGAIFNQLIGETLNTEAATAAAAAKPTAIAAPSVNRGGAGLP